MPNLSSPLVTSAGMPVVNRSSIARAAGFKHLTRAEFDQAVTDERAAIGSGAGLYQAGERIYILGEEGYRTWFVGADAASSHARTVVLVSGKSAVLAADANASLGTTGAPANGTGANGDIATDWATGQVYIKTSGAWAASFSVLTPVVANPVSASVTGVKLVIDPASNYVAQPGEVIIRTIADGVPSGGTVNQVLMKLSSTDYDFGWRTMSGGGTPLATYADAVMADSPLAFWKMDETSGNIIDATGHGHGGTLSTAPNGINRQVGSSGVGGGQMTEFTGLGSFLSSVLGTLGANLGAGVTVAFIFKGTDTTALYSLLGSTNTGSTTAMNILLNSNSSNVLTAGSLNFSLRSDTAVARAVSAPVSIFDNAVHTVMVRLTPTVATGDAILVDGVEVGSYSSKPSAATSSAFSNFGFGMGIGAGNNRGTGMTNPMKGQLAGLAIFAGALSNARAVAHHNALIGVA